MASTHGGPQARPLLRYAGIAAVAGAAAWLTKFMVIWAGTDDENLHGVLHVVGTIALFTALALVVWRATRPRGTGLRGLAVVGAWLLLFVLVGAVEEGLNAWIDAESDSVLEELVLLVFGIPALALGLSALGRSARDERRELQSHP